MTLEGFGGKEEKKTISEIIYPPKPGAWGEFKWPEPLLGPSSEPAAEILMAIYEVDELGHIAITIRTGEEDFKFERTIPFSGLEQALDDRRTLYRAAGRRDSGNYDLGTNILAESTPQPDDYLLEHGTPLFSVRPGPTGSAGNLRVRGYDEKRVEAALDSLKIFTGHNGVNDGRYHEEMISSIRNNGHNV